MSSANFSIVSIFPLAIAPVYHIDMPRAEFEKLVENGYDQLPQWVREKIKNVALLIENEPSPEERREQGLSANVTLLGLYKGIPLAARGENYGIGMTMPDTITLYQLPIERAATQDGVTIDQVVKDTIWHEFAHHFGMNEREVREREGKRYPRL